jgi:hypothetical protein
VADVLNFWIGFDMENLFRIKCGLPHFRVPYDYETNSTKLTGLVPPGWSLHRGHITEGSGSSQRANVAHRNTSPYQGRLGERCHPRNGPSTPVSNRI